MRVVRIPFFIFSDVRWKQWELLQRCVIDCQCLALALPAYNQAVVDRAKKVGFTLSEHEADCVCRIKQGLLCQADSLVGAYTCTCAALCAGIGVDRILVALRDSARRTLVNTGTACDAVVTNYVSHNR